jgi:hypothetical protein
LIYVLLNICLGIRHIFIDHSKHNFWNLRWIFNFQKSVRMRFILFTAFTIIKIFANTAFVSWTNNGSDTTSITFNIKMGCIRIDLLGLLLLNLVWIFFNFLVYQIFFLLFNNTLDERRWLLFQWIFYHFFNSFLLVFPKLFLQIFWRFSAFFTFSAFFSFFSWLRIGKLNLFYFILFFRVRITWTLILFFRRVFTIRFFLILKRFRFSFVWNLIFFFLNKIFEERFLSNASIFLHRLIFQVTLFGDWLIWQDFEFKISIVLVLGPIISS